MQQLLRAAIYARVSSEQPTDGNGIASQIAALEARVAADGLVLPATQRFVDDGYSVSAALRPFLGLLDDQAFFAVAQCQGMSSSMRLWGQPLTRRVSRSAK